MTFGFGPGNIDCDDVIRDVYLYLDDESDPELRNRIRQHLEGHQASFSAVESLRVPVIAAVQRACMGAGLELALCCDVRLAAEGTLFSIPEVQLGLVPDMGGTQRLPAWSAKPAPCRCLWLRKKSAPGEPCALAWWTR